MYVFSPFGVHINIICGILYTTKIYKPIKEGCHDRKTLSLSRTRTGAAIYAVQVCLIFPHKAECFLHFEYIFEIVFCLPCKCNAMFIRALYNSFRAYSGGYAGIRPHRVHLKANGRELNILASNISSFFFLASVFSHR